MNNDNLLIFKCFGTNVKQKSLNTEIINNYFSVPKKKKVIIMDTKGRIGLAIAVIATALSLVMAMASATIVTPPDFAETFLKGCFVVVTADQTVIRDQSFTTPSTCAAHGNLNTNAIMNRLCERALTDWFALTKNKCAAIVLPPPFIGETKPFSPCKMSAVSWRLAEGSQVRSCEEDPGHFSKLICTVKANAICAPPGDCQKTCTTVFKASCDEFCGTDNAACKQACVAEEMRCKMACADP